MQRNKSPLTPFTQLPSVVTSHYFPTDISHDCPNHFRLPTTIGFTYQLHDDATVTQCLAHNLTDVFRIVSRLVVATVLGVIACATSVAQPVHADQVKVLILGDSVASVLRWSPPSMKALWKQPLAVTLEVWGCQKLVDPGCLEGNVPQPSALELLRKHRDEDFDIIVVATGYNDTGAAYLQKSIRRIHAEVKKHDAQLLWLTYRENGNVRVKSRAFNAVVKAQAKQLKFFVLDWEQIARKQKHWFTGDAVHMNARGGIRLGNHIRRALDAIVTGQPISTTTTTPPTTTTTTVAVSG